MLFLARNLFICGLFLFSFFTAFMSYAQDIPSDEVVILQGEKIFDANCKSCHRIKKKLIGPALAGVYDRAPSIDWIKSFVRNSSKVIASGDEYANKIYEENNNTLMTSFTSFNDEQILSILAYIKAETEKPDEGLITVVGGNQQAVYSMPDDYIYAISVVVLLMFMLILATLLLMIRLLKRYLSQRNNLSEDEKELVDSPYTWSTVLQSKGFVFLVIFVVASVTFKTIIDGLYSIGVQKDYQPKQPIAFSHKIHAGEYEIDCQYCHTGVMKGRNANIPSPNTCMNCHTQIRKGTHTGESEIAKIVNAIDTNTPIEWVRVHNLPDLAYFNHSQHVNVAGVACQTCHGPIEEMDVVKQHALLTMGWCIDCHRKTSVKTTDNAYYDKLVELHDGRDMKVEDIGGLECAKCHY